MKNDIFVQIAQLSRAKLKKKDLVSGMMIHMLNNR